MTRPGIVLAGLAAATAAVLLAALPGLPWSAQGIGPMALALLPESGVSNPVTAVLLNFRAYDTLLELVVLLLALLGVRSLGSAPPLETGAAPVLLQALVAWLAPALVVVAGFLLWIGAKAPGGAFQAGALLGAVAILLAQAAPDRLPSAGARPLDLAAVLGPAVFLAVAAASAAAGQTVLQYPPGWAPALILLIEAAATLSIAAVLFVLFLGGGQGRRT